MSSDGSKAIAAGNYREIFVWVSSDGGATWSKTNETAYKVRMSRDGSKMVAFDYRPYNWDSPGYIRLSTDGGSTWTDTGDSNMVRLTSLALSEDGTKMMAGPLEEGGLWFSSDTGASWTELTAAGTMSWYHVAMSADGAKIVAVGYNGTSLGKLVIGQDAGGWTFSEAVLSPTTWRDTAMTADGAVIVGCTSRDGGGVFVSKDGGATWTQTLLRDTVDYAAVAVSDDGMTMVAAVDGGDAWISYDGGEAFESMPQPGMNYWQKGWRGMHISGSGDKILAASGGHIDGRIYIATLVTTTTAISTTVTTSTKTGTTQTTTQTTTAITEISGATTIARRNILAALAAGVIIISNF